MPRAGEGRYKIGEKIISYRVCASGTERRVSCRQFLASLPTSRLTTNRETQVRPTPPSQYTGALIYAPQVAHSLQCATLPLPPVRLPRPGIVFVFPSPRAVVETNSRQRSHRGGFAKEADLTRPPQSSSWSFLQCRPFLQSAFSSERRYERA